MLADASPMSKEVTQIIYYTALCLIFLVTLIYRLHICMYGIRYRQLDAQAGNAQFTADTLTVKIYGYYNNSCNV